MAQRPTITSTHLDGTLWLVRLEGEHDLSTTPGVRETLDRIFDTGTCIVVDLSPATFTESGILGELIRAYLRAESSPDEKVAIVAPAGSAAARPFNLVDATHTCFPVFESPDEAITSCGGAAAPA